MNALSVKMVAFFHLFQGISVALLSGGGQVLQCHPAVLKKHWSPATDAFLLAVLQSCFLWLGVGVVK